jgi:hypothetical protein
MLERLLKRQVLLASPNKEIAYGSSFVGSPQHCASSDPQRAFQRERVGGQPSGIKHSRIDLLFGADHAKQIAALVTTRRVHFARCTPRDMVWMNWPDRPHR